MEIVVDNPINLPYAWRMYYSRLAEAFSENLKSSKLSSILEPGAGKGQLTLPLVQRLPRSTRYTVVEPSRGPYSGWLQNLTVALQESGTDRVKILKSDARKMRTVKSASVDAVISNELLCDLPRECDIIRAFKEFHRVLRPAGLMIHGEWSSIPSENPEAFRLSHHPAWNPDQLHTHLVQTGFDTITTFYFETGLVFRKEAAVREAESWTPAQSSLLGNRERLRKYGLCIPPEHIMKCRKASSPASSEPL